MAKAKQGDKVAVHYTGKLEDGRVFDSSREREPLEFTLGEGKIIPGFEVAVAGMDVGEKKTIKLPPEEAYGARREEMVVEMGRDKLPEGIEPQVGQHLQLKSASGQALWPAKFLGHVVGRAVELPPDLVGRHTQLG